MNEAESRHMWQALREIGLAKIIGSMFAIIVVSASTATGVAVWVANTADLADVRMNQAAIAAIRDSLAAGRDIASRQDRTITGLATDFDRLANDYCRVLQGQSNLAVQMERLMCRMDGNFTPNQCDLRHPIREIGCS